MLLALADGRSFLFPRCQGAIWTKTEVSTKNDKKAEAPWAKEEEARTKMDTSRRVEMPTKEYK